MLAFGPPSCSSSTTLRLTSLSSMFARTLASLSIYSRKAHDLQSIPATVWRLLMEFLLCNLYPLLEPPSKRTKHLKVLCLCVSRSATEALRFALIRLGYDKVAHGFDWWLSHPGHSVTYHRLALAKLSSTKAEASKGSSLYVQDFDRVLGAYEAVTDVPAVWFATELLRAYPDAKVVLNRKADVEAWKGSLRDSILPIMQSWGYWWTSLFEKELFWSLRVTNLMWGRFFNGDFEQNAATAYEEHYPRLEEVLEEQKRGCLHWQAGDGW